MARDDPARHDDVGPRHAARDGTWNPEQRPEADVNIEFQSTSQRADEAIKLAFFFREAIENTPPTIRPRWATTCQHGFGAFMDIVPAISLRETSAGCTPARVGTPRASADRRLHYVLGQGFSPGTERGADHAERGGATNQCEG